MQPIYNVKTLMGSIGYTFYDATPPEQTKPSVGVASSVTFFGKVCTTLLIGTLVSFS
jgi:hypothetical protein